VAWHLLRVISSEPCIRGHRSTKCTHANERLMVPVKKPGRPLTACPHLQPHICGCSSITAAIPRKSQCGCGTPDKTESVGASALPEAPSPTKVHFRVQKSSSKSASRKQSYDAGMLEKMDPSNVNIVPFQSNRPQQLIAPALPNAPSNGHRPSMPQTSYYEGTPSALYPHTPSPQQNYGSLPFASSNGNGNYNMSNNSETINNGVYIPMQPLPETMLASRPVTSQEGSCCGPKNGIKQEFDSQEQATSRNGSCCSKDSMGPLNSSPFLDGSQPSSTNGASQIPQYAYAPAYPMNPPLYPPYVTHTTIYAYPPSYGSYQNPLQPASWRQSVMANMYAQPSQQLALDTSHDLAGFIPIQTQNADLNTLHSCGCGDSCQCIGCAAHPYNDATQEYVRSAMKVASMEPHTPTFSPNTTSNPYSPVATPIFNGYHPNGSPISNSSLPSNGNSKLHDINHTNTNAEVASPLADTPSDTGASGTSEEQTLSAADFFFVNYPFSAEECGGDSMVCPCGDDCSCLGCTIHRMDPAAQGIGMDLNSRQHQQQSQIFNRSRPISISDGSAGIPSLNGSRNVSQTVSRSGSVSGLTGNSTRESRAGSLSSSLAGVENLKPLVDGIIPPPLSPVVERKSCCS
jgi:hypothetical protein